MCDRFRPNLHPCRRRNGGRRTWHLPLWIFIACLWAGCTAQKKYQVLSFFFDGVPDPNAPRNAALGRGSGEATGAFRPLLASSHKPYVEEKCDACHVGGSGAMSAFTSVTSDVCLKCHEAVPHEYPMMHGPVAVTACLWCHNPHESNQPSLLKSPAPELCMQCHDLRTLSAAPPEHHAPSPACLKCHTGHGGAQRYFLRPGTAPVSQQAPAPASAPGPAPGAKPAGAVTLSSFLGRPAPAPVKEGTSNDARPPEKVVLLQAAAPQAPGGPVVIGEAPKREGLHFNPVTGSLDFTYRRENDHIDPAVGRGSTFKEDRYEETLSLATTGYYIHPNLVELSLAGTFGLRQDQIENAGDDSNEESIIYDYDISGTLLRNGPAPFTVYSRRNTEVINRTFGPSLDATVMTTGAVLDWHGARIPTRLEVYHMDQDLEALDGSENFQLSQNTFNWQSEARPAEHQHFTWNYSFNNVDESSKVRGLGGTRSNQFDIHDATATHTWDFGEKERHNLTSSVNYFNQTGDFPLERLRWDERLRLRHSEQFETFYQYTLNYQAADSPDAPGIDQTQHTGIGGFTHRLYKSLVTTGNAGVRDLDRSDGSGSFAYFGGLNFDYHKQVPMGGLSATLGFGYERQRNDAQTGVSHVANDVRTFNDPLPIVIAGGNVDPASIVVRDATGIVVYVEGLDYLVNVFPDRVELLRVVGGRITPGQTVRLDYDLLPQPSNTVTNNLFSTSLRYDIERGPLRGLGVYGRFVTLDQDIDSAQPDFFFPNSYTDTVVGSDYRFWEQRATLGAERQWHDSEIAPFDATRFYGRLVYRFRDVTNSVLALNADYTILDYPDENNHVELLLVSGTFARQLTQHISGSVTVTYRDQQDDIFGPTHGVEGSAELRWKYRQSQVYVQVRDSLLETDPQDTQFQSVVVGLRREF